MKKIFISLIEIMESCGKERLEMLMQPTELFNEGWMLRLILKWFSKSNDLGHPLSFSPKSRWFSEALLKPPFVARKKKDSSAEQYTHADGVIGRFIIGSSGKGDLGLSSDTKQFILLEAKIYSKLSSGISNDRDYDQVARSIACMSQAICNIKLDINKLDRFGFYVIAPKEQFEKEKSFVMSVNKESIKKKVEKRMRDYNGGKKITEWYERWFMPALDKISVKCISWEEILDYIGKADKDFGRQLLDFYNNCLKYNKNKVGGRND